MTGPEVFAGVTPLAGLFGNGSATKAMLSGPSWMRALLRPHCETRRFCASLLAWVEDGKGRIVLVVRPNCAAAEAAAIWVAWARWINGRMKRAAWAAGRNMVRREGDSPVSLCCGALSNITSLRFELCHFLICTCFLVHNSAVAVP